MRTWMAVIMVWVVCWGVDAEVRVQNLWATNVNTLCFDTWEERYYSRGDSSVALLQVANTLLYVPGVGQAWLSDFSDGNHPVMSNGMMEVFVGGGGAKARFTYDDGPDNYGRFRLVFFTGVGFGMVAWMVRFLRSIRGEGAEP